MIDMKQIKENVSNKIKKYQSTEAEEQIIKPTRENKMTNPSSTGYSDNTVAIGASIRIKGDVTGDENLEIQGKIEGTVSLKGHNVTICKTGKVKADIVANQIIVEGDLVGDMHGDEMVVIRKSGNALGNIISPRVILEDGAMFKGSIEMEPRKTTGNTAELKTA